MMFRWLVVSIGVCMAWAEPVAAEMTYADTVAECKALFEPLVPAAQVQPLIPGTALRESAEITGNAEVCFVEFREKDWASDKPGSATPLALISVAHGASSRAAYLSQESMTRGMLKDKFESLDPKGLAGVESAYAYSAFGRHWLVMLVPPNAVTVQVRESQGKAALDGLAQLVLKAIEHPTLQDWRKRQ